MSSLTKLLDKALIVIGRNLLIILPCIAIAADMLLYAITDCDKHLSIFIASTSITLLGFSLFRIASKLRPRKFSFEQLLNDGGASIQEKDPYTLQICRKRAIFAELHLDELGVVSSIKTQNFDGGFTTKFADIAPKQPFYKAVRIGEHELYFTPQMALYIAGLTLSLGKSIVRKDEVRQQARTYFSGVDFIYS